MLRRKVIQPYTLNLPVGIYIVLKRVEGIVLWIGFFMKVEIVSGANGSLVF